MTSLNQNVLAGHRKNLFYTVVSRHMDLLHVECHHPVLAKIHVLLLVTVQKL